jgi:sulfate adenylyltransferase subunit 2
MLYSIGKDSTVMAHLALKAFAPGRIPFPCLHVDTTFKFREMYDFRTIFGQRSEVDLLIHINQEGVANNINPFDHGSSKYTDIMKTQGLKQALNNGQYDAAFGGARREEEKSRAKERIFSFRDRFHQWDPKNQRPELWSQYNGKINQGESIRVFPLSNWTELDIWQYIHLEQIQVVPLYFAAPRRVVVRNGTLIMIDDERLPYTEEEVEIRTVRFRTLGCYPLSGAIESTASTVPEIIQEMMVTRMSERENRLIDKDEEGSMERKKREGYF